MDELDPVARPWWLARARGSATALRDKDNDERLLKEIRLTGEAGAGTSAEADADSGRVTPTDLVLRSVAKALRTSGADPGAPAAFTAPHVDIACGNQFLRTIVDVPCLPAGTVRVRRMVAELARGIRTKPLTTICAPAGAGKTVLAASWASAPDVDWPVAWLTMAEATGQPGQFWLRLHQAIRRSGAVLPRVGRRLRDEHTYEGLLERLAADIVDQPVPIVLIIDGCDALSADQSAGLDFLLRHAGSRFRLVLCGREEPMLPLHRYRLDDSVHEMGSGSLAFTAPETVQLAARLGVQLPTEWAAELTARTEGWVAGLRIAALALRQGADPDGLMTSLAHTDSSLGEYLLAEVLEPQPPDIRQVLLRASVPAQLEPELLDHLIGRADSHQSLRSLARAHVFIERSPQAPHRYRMHSLFRALLRAHLASESPAAYAQLNRRSARWFAAAGDELAALQHAVSGQDWDFVTSLLIDGLAVGPILACDDSPHIGFVEALPEDVMDEKATALRAAVLIARGRHVPPLDMAQLARVIQDENMSATLRVSAAAVISLADSAPTHRPDVARAAAAAVASLRELPSAETPGSRAIRAVVLSATALGARWRPDDDRGAQGLSAAISACEEASAHRLQRLCLAEMALLNAMRGNLERGREFAEAAAALRIGTGGEGARLPAAGAVALAWIHCEQLRHEDARRWAARAEQAMTGRDAPVVQPLVALLRARIARHSIGFSGARRQFGEVGALSDSPSWIREQTLIERADWHAMQQRAADAAALLDALPRPHTLRAELLRRRTNGPADCADRADRTQAVMGSEAPLALRVEALLTQCRIHLAREEVRHAVGAMKNALRIAKPEKLRRPFIDSAPDVRRLLRSRAELHAASAWLAGHDVDQKSDGGCNAEVRSSATSPIETAEPLSDRETEVLRLMSDLLSTAEIGAALFVSVNTVRTHVRSILRKLGVSRRADAVRRARELALI